MIWIEVELLYARGYNQSELKLKLVMTERKIFRFKFTPELYDNIIEFCSLHKYDDKQRLKENFKIWCEENRENLKKEQELLDAHNYSSEENVEIKIFKSMKYYHIKNMLKVSAEPTKPKYHRDEAKNIRFSAAFLVKMNDYILENMKQDDFKPAIYFEKFINDQADEISLEKRGMMEKYQFRSIDDDTINRRIKKSFKNQYFTIIRN